MILGRKKKNEEENQEKEVVGENGWADS